MIHVFWFVNLEFWIPISMLVPYSPCENVYVQWAVVDSNIDIHYKHILHQLFVLVGFTRYCKQNWTLSAIARLVCVKAWMACFCCMHQLCSELDCHLWLADCKPHAHLTFSTFGHSICFFFAWRVFMLTHPVNKRIQIIFPNLVCIYN